MQFVCCGYSGPKEFAYQDDPLDESCYEHGTIANNGTVNSNSTTEVTIGDNHILKQVIHLNIIMYLYITSPLYDGNTHELYISNLNAIICSHFVFLTTLTRFRTLNHHEY